jgi:hypothetical protein
MSGHGEPAQVIINAHKILAGKIEGKRQLWDTVLDWWVIFK